MCKREFQNANGINKQHAHYQFKRCAHLSQDSCWTGFCLFCAETGRNDFLKHYLQKWGWIRRMNPAASVVQNGAGAMGCL